VKRFISICLVAVLSVTSILTLPGCSSGAEWAEPQPGVQQLLPETVEGRAIAQQEPQTSQRIFSAADTPLRAEPLTLPPSGEVLSGHEPRDGYILAPTMFGLSGIDPLSSFVLRTPSAHAGTPPITIDGEPEPVVTRENGNTFIVTPAVALMPNSVYVFRISREDGDITWAFQTSISFEIVTSLPRNQSANVPVRTGIEIMFSYGSEIDISDYFSIYPHVDGRFIHRDSTAIFMPRNALAHGRIYTVTIRAGITLPGTSEVIESDYRFSFETAQEGNRRPLGSDPRVHFQNRNVEFPTFDAPRVTFWVSYRRDEARPPVDFSVYRIDSRREGIAAATRLSSLPSWSQLTHDDRMVDTSNLTRVHFETVYERRDDEARWNETFTLPNNLRPGFYVINASAGDTRNQMIVQVTDLAVQVVADNSMAVVWVNDMRTGRPAAGANVYDPVSGRTFQADAQGVAVVERMLSDGEYLIVTSADGRPAVVFVRPSVFHSAGGRSLGGSPHLSRRGRDDYWAVLQLDRLLFQRSDTVSLWGFVQNRHQYENIPHVTATLTEVWRWGMWGGSSNRDTLHRVNIPVSYGTYAGEIRLPNLNPGSYELAIFHGDILLSSIIFTVMDYVTPPYRLTVTPGVNAIFLGEEVTFYAMTQFFEGTPVSELEISYSVHGTDLTGFPNSGQRQTDVDGQLELSVRPQLGRTDAQAERTLRFMAEANLPEIGRVMQSANVRVFINDIHMRSQASRSGAEASLTVNINDITLERLNDGTAEHRSDFLGEPVANQRISVEIEELSWERVRSGEFYDHVTRQVVPSYTFVVREFRVEQFEMTTDADGVAERTFTVPDRERVSYRARITTADGNGRVIVNYRYFGRDFSEFFRLAGDSAPFLYGADSGGYDIGDTVELTIMSGGAPVTQGNFMFVVVRDGILSYHVGANPLTFTFDESHVPNARVVAIHFNGHTYYSGWRMAQHLRFNPRTRLIDIEISAGESYRPGDEVTVTVRTTDTDGNPKAANVNISIVDEALFALREYEVNTLSMLYRGVSDNLRFSMSTHRTFVSDGVEVEGFLADGEAETPAMAAPSPSGPGMAEEAAAVVRERFEDTATFQSLRTDSRGQGSFTFRLPHNITSWRVTASAISDDLYAGNSVSNLRVTQPMFLHYSLSSTFLVGDRPYIGVNVYGTALTGGETVNFEVWRDSAPDDIRRATGTSFARVNIPLWEKAEQGAGSLTIRATVAGHSDAVRHAYTVLDSHRQVDTAVFYEVTAGTVFGVNPGGLTDITFTDRGRGTFLSDLFALRNTWWGSGARIEGFVTRREATRLIETHFPDIELFDAVGSVDLLDYQISHGADMGGIAILPYAYAELQTTVMLLPFIKEDVNLPALTGYLRRVFHSSETDNRMLALYGLAMLGEPVLLDLQSYAKLEGLSVRNTAYIALGFAALGERQMALTLYNERIAPHVQALASLYRVNDGANRAQILDATSVTALLAAQLGLPESTGMFEYSMRYRRHDVSYHDGFLRMNVERLKFISHEIVNREAVTASITYTLFGETVTRDLGNRRSFRLRIPAMNISEFNIVSVTGDVGAVSVVRTALEDFSTVENDIVVRREFFRAGSNISSNTFEQGDLVRVQITIEYSARSLGGSYVVTDFLPAGLVHLPHSARFDGRTGGSGLLAFARTEGQRVTFFDSNSTSRGRRRTYHYYARVVNPGTFTAEGTLVQNVGVREYMAVGANAVLTINP